VPRPAFALVALLVLVACGGDDAAEQSAPTSSTPTTEVVADAPGTTLTSTTTVAPRRDPSDPLCVAATTLRDADEQYQLRLAEGVHDALEQKNVAPLNEVLTQVDEDGTLRTLLAAYDALAAEVPPEQQANVATLQAFTEEFFRGVNGLPNFGEIQSYIDALAEDPEAQAANEAGADLDAYVRQECGAGITSTG
jgi:hypothetical protein